MAWTQLPLGKASGKQGPAQGSARATHALGRVLPLGNQACIVPRLL